MPSINALQAYYARKEYKKAIERADQMLLEGKNPMALYIKGLSLYNLNESKSTIEAMKELIALEDNVLAYNIIAESYLKLGEINDAISYFERLLSKDKDNFAAMKKLATLYSKKNKEKAQDYCYRLLEAGIEDNEIKNLLAKLRS